MGSIPNPLGNLTLTRTSNETLDTVSFFFKTFENKSLSFKPGQFINIGVTINQQNYYRSYSISSLPTDDEIQLTIKRVPDGIVSNWLVDHLNVGDTIQTHSIAGNFNIIDSKTLNKHLIFISAGCGITPIMSMVRYLLQYPLEHTHKISFIHCARDENNLIYEEKVQELAKNHKQFSATFYIDQFIDSKNLSVTHQQGPLDYQKLEQHLTKDDSNIFLCGPTGFMEMIQNHLIQLNFNMDYFKHESFTPDVGTISQSIDNNQQHIVSVPAFDIAIEATNGEILLEVLQNNGVPIIAACRSGLCGSCKCQVIEGHIETHHKGVEHGLLTEEEVEQGYTLACSSTIKSAVTIEI